MLDKKSFQERLTFVLDELDIPNHMVDGIINYIIHGVEPGGFLTSVLENNFYRACLTADSVNKQHLTKYANLLLSVPSGCWGSKDAVSNWCKNGGLYGK